ncbi:MAG: PP2C family protein-serine/threonine phosphatase [Acidobacteria bacterium]|nr:PP2C family protein-serine/threonine phosphatase [Acidobacteriota bacterium]
MTSGTLGLPTLPRGAALLRRESPLRLIAAWAGGSAVIGGLIGAALGILVVRQDQGFDWWFVKQSVLFAEIIGLSAIIGSRYAFPLLEGMPRLLRHALVLATLIGGALAATALSLALRPGLVFTHKLPYLVGLVGANVVLALLVGGALIAWETLKRRLARAYDELRVKEAMEREIALARDVQQELLPKQAPDLPGYEIAFSCEPAGLIGGDTFEFVVRPDGRVALAVGDVVGKGIAAALQMANVQALIRAVAPVEGDPARLNAILSGAIGSRAKPGRYVTFAYLVLDASDGSFEYSLAGHLPPIVAGPRGVRLLERGGLPLGLVPDMPYERGADRLEVGEVLVLYTDGLVEAAPDNDPDRQFGRERLVEMVQDRARGTAEALLEQILDEQHRHCAGTPAADDTTLIVLRRSGAADGARG